LSAAAIRIGIATLLLQSSLTFSHRADWRQSGHSC